MTRWPAAEKIKKCDGKSGPLMGVAVYSEKEIRERLPLPAQNYDKNIGITINKLRLRFEIADERLLD